MKLRRIARASWDVVAVCTERGDCPVTDFLASLGGQLARQSGRMFALLTVVAQDGPPRSGELTKKLQGDIWEFRRNDLRVLWFYDQGRVVVCTHGFVKKSQKTPAAEIATAAEWLARYRAAKRNGLLKLEPEVDE